MKEPFFLISKSKILEQYNILKDKCLIISYSVKTNPLVTKILEDKTDSLFSVHSINELEFIKDKSRVIFLAQGLDFEILDKLINEKVKFFVIDNKKDLEVIENYINENKVKIKLGLRIKLKEHSIFTERYFVFGMDSSFVNKKILELKGKVEEIGIHFHKKTQNISEWSFKQELEDTLTKDVLNAIDFLNMGGGLPIKYKNSSDKYINSVFDKINELSLWLRKFDVKTYIEPGRFIAGPAGVLKTNVKSVEGKNIIINASVYNSFPDTLVDDVKLLIKDEKDEGIEYIIKGCTPCSLDIFRYSVKLDKVKEGDEIIFLNATAYNYYTDFCNLEKIKTKIVE